nr:WXG100 family type VII secretion target [Saccharopolyspora hordei]
MEDVVPAQLAELVGHQDDLRAAARVWRETADAVEQATGDVHKHLGGIDAAWQGADAEAFLAHVREVGLAGNDLIDAMRALADVLEHTVESVQEQVDDLGEVIAEAADVVSAALLLPEGGAERARVHLSELADPVQEVVESISDTYRAFARFCDDLEAGRSAGPVQFDDRVPAQPWDFTAPTEAAPPAPEGTEAHANGDAAGSGGTGGEAGGGGAGTVAAGGGGAGTVGAAPDAGEPPLAEGGRTAAGEPSSATPPAAAATGGAVAAGAAGGAVAGGMYGGMMPMGAMGAMGGAQGGGQERKNQSRLRSTPEQLFGTPPEAAPAVFGAPSSQQPNPEPVARSGKLDIPSTLHSDGPRKSIDDALHPKQPGADKPKSAAVGDAPPPKPRTGTASVGDAPPPRRRGED